MSSVEQYPANGYYIFADTSTTQLGSYVIGSGYLRYAHLRILNRNTSSYSYGLQLVLSTSLNGPAIATSETLTFDNATTGQNADVWLCDVNFVFDDYMLLSTEEYYIRLETTGYSSSASTYLAVWCDWLEPVNGSNKSAARIAFEVMR